jgi:hypothetical protein
MTASAADPELLAQAARRMRESVDPMTPMKEGRPCP